MGFVQVDQQATVGVTEGSFFKRLAISIYDLISPEQRVVNEVVIPKSEGIENTEVGHDQTSVVDTNATKTVHTSLVIGPGEVLTTTRIESIRDSFSDDVSVSIDPHNPDTGIIIPHFKDRDGEPYRYLMVPVNADPQ